MSESNFLKSYPNHVIDLQTALPPDAALEAAVGGDFITVGKLERALLLSLGLSGREFVVDVGCGSGRLALQLSSFPELRYLGTDIVSDLLAHARRITRRNDWQFARTDGTSIPCENARADFVCFFSVFTHLTHEDTFRYLREARRILRPGGRIVFSFLEFSIDSHWWVFQQSLEHSRAGDHLNQFMDRHAIAAWARHLELCLDFVADGDRPHIAIGEELTWHDGRVIQKQGSLGQSVAVLSKPANRTTKTFP